MKLWIAAAAMTALAACSDEPRPKPAAPAPPAPAVENKAPEPPRAEAPRPDPNKELAQRVKTALQGAKKVDAGGIDVTAADGKVTLWGTTATDDERRLAAQVASRVDGVKAVDNRLKVVQGS